MRSVGFARALMQRHAWERGNSIPASMSGARDSVVRAVMDLELGGEGCPRRRFAKRARGGDPRPSGARERSWGLRPSERSAEEDTPRRPRAMDYPRQRTTMLETARLDGSIDRDAPDVKKHQVNFLDVGSFFTRHCDNMIGVTILQTVLAA